MEYHQLAITSTAYKDLARKYQNCKDELASEK